MQSLKKFFFLLPLLVLLCGAGFVPPRETGGSIPSLSAGISHTSEKQPNFSKGYASQSNKTNPYEIVESSSSFQKDLTGGPDFSWFTFKDFNHSFFRLLSKRLSLYKPALITLSCVAVYLVIRVLLLWSFNSGKPFLVYAANALFGALPAILCLIIHF